MKLLKQSIATLLCISLCTLLTHSQPAPDKQQEAQAGGTIAQDVLIIIEQEQVRFTAQKSVAEMRLEVFDQSGRLVYDSGAVTEPDLTWALQQPDGEAVKSGLYAYTLSVKVAGGEKAQVWRGHFIVDRAKERDGQTDRLWITSQNESGVGTKLTVARNEGVTIAVAGGAAERVSRKKRAGKENEPSLNNTQNEGIAPAVTGTGITGRIVKFTAAEELGNSGITEAANGNVGIGTASPISKLHIVSAASDLPPRLQSSATGTFAAGWDFYHGSTGAGYVGVPDVGTGLAPGEMLVYGVGPTSLWAGRQRSVTITPNANVGIGTVLPEQKLHVDGNEILSTGYQAGFKFRNRGSTSGADDWVWYSAGNIARLWRANVGDLMTIDTNGRVGVNVLQIRGGSDFAENFDVNVATAGGEAIKPKVEAGMVVSIDSATPGKLALSTQAYDRRVAGVISGAGGVKPGMVMSQEGTAADGKYPVALSGRVYCWVDASHGAIEPGDLLTTSSTLGHAMKAADAVKAQGAIIGKAMTGLKEGKGLVLVLVTLQ